MTREITLAKAVNEAIAEEMRRDPTVFLMGEDVAEAGTPFKVLAGLVDEFGPERVIDTPISEPGFVGMAVGAAMTGSRPIVDLMFGDFLYLVMDQLCNQAAKTHYMSGGKLKVPMVLRTNLGATDHGVMGQHEPRSIQSTSRRSGIRDDGRHPEGSRRSRRRQPRAPVAPVHRSGAECRRDPIDGRIC